MDGQPKKAAQVRIERIPIDQLKPADYNPRVNLVPGYPEYDALEASIEHFGYIEPIVWNKRTGNVVGGHQRLKILKNEQKVHEVDVVVVDLDESNEKLLNIALNNDHGHFDKDMLGGLVSELNSLGIDLSIANIRGDGLDDLEDKEEQEVSGRDPVYPIEPVFNEKYDYVLIVARNETDYAWLQTVFGLKMTQSYKSANKIGMGRVVTCERFQELWKSRS